MCSWSSSPAASTSGFYYVCLHVLCLSFLSQFGCALLNGRRALDGIDESGWTSQTVSIDLCVFSWAGCWRLGISPEQFATIALPFGGRAQKIPPSLIAQPTKAEAVRLMSIHQVTRKTMRYGFITSGVAMMMIGIRLMNRPGKVILLTKLCQLITRRL